MTETKKDETWYVAIMKMPSNWYDALVAVGSSFYRSFSNIAKRNGVEIVAEQFDVTDEQINRIEGFNENERKVRESSLTALVTRLNAGEQLDAKQELAKLVKAA